MDFDDHTVSVMLFNLQRPDLILSAQIPRYRQSGPFFNFFSRSVLTTFAIAARCHARRAPGCAKPAHDDKGNACVTSLIPGQQMNEGHVPRRERDDWRYHAGNIFNAFSRLSRMALPLSRVSQQQEACGHMVDVTSG